jgi:hypothetical protein
MIVKKSSNPITPPESPNSKASPKSTGLSLSGLNSFDRFMKKNKNKKPSSSLLNREMNKARGVEILKLKKDIEYLNSIIKGRDEYINRLHNWNVYTDMKPALCNKRSIIKKGRIKKKKLSQNKRKKGPKKLSENKRKKDPKKLSENKRKKNSKYS